MLRYFIIILVILPLRVVKAQDQALPDPQPYFMAFIVSDIDSSIAWYQEVFGLEQLNYVSNEERGFKQANLSRGNMLIELIELDRADTLDSTKLFEGIFKVGIIVDELDRWVDHFKEEQVRLFGDVMTDPITNRRMLILFDPDGNRIQVFEK